MRCVGDEAPERACGDAPLSLSSSVCAAWRRLGDSALLVERGRDAGDGGQRSGRRAGTSGGGACAAWQPSALTLQRPATEGGPAHLSARLVCRIAADIAQLSSAAGGCLGVAAPRQARRRRRRQAGRLRLRPGAWPIGSRCSAARLAARRLATAGGRGAGTGFSWVALLRPARLSGLEATAGTVHRPPGLPRPPRQANWGARQAVAAPEPLAAQGPVAGKQRNAWAGAGADGRPSLGARPAGVFAMPSARSRACLVDRTPPWSDHPAPDRFPTAPRLAPVPSAPSRHLCPVRGLSSTPAGEHDIVAAPGSPFGKRRRVHAAAAAAVGRRQRRPLTACDPRHARRMRPHPWRDAHFLQVPSCLCF